MHSDKLTPHGEYARKVGVSTPCRAEHVNFSGGCLNCGYQPEGVTRHTCQHRVYVDCPKCHRKYSMGRFNQHWPNCKGVQP